MGHKAPAVETKAKRAEDEMCIVTVAKMMCEEMSNNKMLRIWRSSYTFESSLLCWTFLPTRSFIIGIARHVKHNSDIHTIKHDRCRVRGDQSIMSSTSTILKNSIILLRLQAFEPSLPYSHLIAIANARR
jgi:hypothetical protein